MHIHILMSRRSLSNGAPLLLIHFYWNPQFCFPTPSCLKFKSGMSLKIFLAVFANLFQYYLICQPMLYLLIWICWWHKMCSTTTLQSFYHNLRRFDWCGLKPFDKLIETVRSSMNSYGTKWIIVFQGSSNWSDMDLGCQPFPSWTDIHEWSIRHIRKHTLETRVWTRVSGTPRVISNFDQKTTKKPYSDSFVSGFRI